MAATLDKESFKKAVELLAVRVPVKQLGTLVKNAKLSPHLYPTKKVVTDPGAKSHKLLLFRSEIGGLDDLPDDVRAVVDAVPDHTVASHTHWVTYESLTYRVPPRMPWQHFSLVECTAQCMPIPGPAVDEVMSSILPKGIPVPASFETVGHIAHFNLRPHQDPYKHLLAQVDPYARPQPPRPVQPTLCICPAMIPAVLVEKTPNVATVVNKVGILDNQFRELTLEVLAGDPNLVATVREHDCVYKFDYSKVFWNSRLQAEHLRLPSLFRDGDIVCMPCLQLRPVDCLQTMYVPGWAPLPSPVPSSGDAPFVPGCLLHTVCDLGPGSPLGCACRNLRVFANDLNPDSHSALQTCATLNHVQDLVSCHCMDGNDFVKQMLASMHEHSSAPAVQAANPPKGDRAAVLDPHRPPPLLFVIALRTWLTAGSPSTGKQAPKTKPRVVPLDKHTGGGPPIALPPGRCRHFILNLPGSAVQFLPSFHNPTSSTDPAVVHCYTFSPHPTDPEGDAVAQVRSHLKVSEGSLTVLQAFVVRDVAPQKVMVCVSFLLDKNMEPGTSSAVGDGASPAQAASASSAPTAPASKTARTE
eukprot:gene7737-1386_t